MTKSRISMVVAAAGLVLVGLLAAVLFTPSDDDTTNEDTAKGEEEVTPVEPKSVPMKSVLDYELTVPPIPTGPTVETEQPKPEVKPEPKQPEPEAKGGVIEYKIQPGDMISKLAVKYGCKSEDIYKLNDGLNKETAAKIRVGQTVRIPVGKEGAAAVANAATISASGTPTSIAAIPTTIASTATSRPRTSSAGHHNVPLAARNRTSSPKSASHIHLFIVVSHHGRTP